MRPYFNHSSLVEHHDHVGLTDSRQTVRDEEDREVFEAGEEVVTDLAFSFVIKCTSSLIHYQQLGVA